VEFDRQSTREKTKMKIVKKSMRLWFTFASIFSFLTGWVLFSHANKPAPLQSSQPVINAPVSSQPLQSINRNTSSGGFLFPPQSQTNILRPRLRTGGS
jgi:hypothetical protein